MANELDIRLRALAQLRRHTHQLIAAGYRKMTPAIYAEWKEPDITGELCRAIQDYIESSQAPDWVTNYALRDDPKLNVAGKHGESRPRIDIEFELVRRGSRPRFRFEAKRLGPRHTLGVYLGSEGMGAFLSDYYPLTHPEAGMLGYVQSDTVNDWLSKLIKIFQRESEQYFIVKDGFNEDILTQGLVTWKSEHLMPKTSLKIWHTLLLFK
jgi:hypothetical protein